MKGCCSMNLDIVLLFSFLLFGLMCLYTAFRLWREKALFDSFILYPGNCKRPDCLDPDGFMAYIRPRVTIFGVLCIVISLYYVADYYLPIPKIATIAHYVVSIGFLIWASWTYYRAAKLFW